MPNELIPNDAILVFLQNGYFGPGENSENIIDELPYLSAGHMDFTELMTLFRFYAYYNNLYTNNRVIPDDFINYCFGGPYPAFYYVIMNREGRIEKLEMTTALELGLIDRPLNTYEMLPALVNEFTGEFLDIATMTQIIKLNSVEQDIDENTAGGISADITKLINARKNIRNFTINSNTQIPDGYGMEKITTIIQGWKTKNARYTGISY